MDNSEATKKALQRKEILQMIKEAREAKETPLLRGFNLRDADLAGADLSGVDFSKADLDGADLEQSNLEGAKLVRANLSGANLYRAHLKDADMKRAVVDSATLFRPTLTGADLSEVDFGQAGVVNLQGSDMGGAKLFEANLSCLDLTGLNGATLSGAEYSDLTVWPDGFDPVGAGARIPGSDSHEASGHQKAQKTGADLDLLEAFLDEHGYIRRADVLKKQVAYDEFKNFLEEKVREHKKIIAEKEAELSPIRMYLSTLEYNQRTCWLMFKDDQVAE